MSIWGAVMMISLWLGSAQLLGIHLHTVPARPALARWGVTMLRIFCTPDWLAQVGWRWFCLPVVSPWDQRTPTRTQPCAYTSALPHHVYALTCSLLA